MHLLMVGMLVDLLMHVELLPETETNQLTIQEGNPTQGALILSLKLNWPSPPLEHVST